MRTTTLQRQDLRLPAEADLRTVRAGGRLRGCPMGLQSRWAWQLLVLVLVLVAGAAGLTALKPSMGDRPTFGRPCSRGVQAPCAIHERAEKGAFLHGHAMPSEEIYRYS